MKSKKKTIRKDLIEPLVVQRLMVTLNNSYMESIANMIVNLSRKQNTGDVTSYLEMQLAENQTAIGNLLKALEQGKSVDIIAEQIAK